MKNTLLVSESLVGSLCKEVEFIRQRVKIIKGSLFNCHDKILKRRLEVELESHNQRKSELLSITNSLVKNNREDLSNLFLIELFNRK